VFKCFTFFSSSLTNVFVYHCVKRNGFKFICCHNYLFFVLFSKYCFLISSAFLISFGGVFCVFFKIPCVATTKVSFPSALSQNEKSRYALLLYKVLNSQMKSFNFLKSSLSVTN